jgi:hypothetical protein
MMTRRLESAHARMLQWFCRNGSGQEDERMSKMVDNLSREVTNNTIKTIIYKILRWIFALLFCCTILVEIPWLLSSPPKILHGDCQIGLGPPGKMSAEEEACLKIIAEQHAGIAEQNANKRAIDTLSVAITLLIVALLAIGLLWVSMAENAFNKSLAVSTEAKNDNPQV